MKFKKGKKIIAKNVCDCKGWRSLIGLRFKKSFKPYDAYLIHLLPDSVLDTFFVPIKFTAIWLDKNLKILRIKTCIKNKFYLPIFIIWSLTEIFYGFYIYFNI
jgi:hypothetical protein